MMSTIQMAMELHRQGRLAEAESHYRNLLTRSPEQFEALHLFGILKLQQGNLPEALTLISKALEINPSSNDARSNLIAVLLNMGRAAEAAEHCNSMLALNPVDAGALYNRALAMMQLGRHEEALGDFSKVLSIKPDHANALFNRAGVLASLRRYQDAMADFDRLLTFAPGHADALTNRGTILAQLGRDVDALASFDRALAVAPGHVHALSNRGIALKKLLQPREALASLDRALAIKPDHVEAHINRGNVLLDLHRAEDALVSFERALSLAPGHPNALTNKAFSLHALGRYEAALEACEQALSADPEHDNVYLIRGHILAKLGQPDSAAESYDRVMALNPNHRFAFGAALMAHRTACNWKRIDELLPAAAQAVRAGDAVIPPFNLLGLPTEPSIQLACAKNFMRRQLPVVAMPFATRARSTSDKIKLAYVSGDFRRHPVAYLIAELLERHDRSRFDVIGISYGADDGSDERKRLVQACDQFHDVWARDEQDAASLINRLNADIAIDLGGHTENSRPGILQRRPAPVQVSYLGYTGTMGVDFIDYVIADRIALPIELAPYFTEKIVHLPDCFLVNDAKKQIAPQTPTRSDAGLPEQGFVFCCFNNNFKISESIFSVWMRLLAAVDGSVLWLSQMNGPAADRLRAAATAMGIDHRRIVFAPRVPSMADHLARQRLADLFIDTSDYNAHTTSSDALWAGVPLVTCIGSAFPGRVAASLLHAVGLPELVTSSLEDYESLALQLARDPERLQAIRDRLAANRLTYPLYNTDRFRRHIELAYATMLEILQRGESPRHFTVGPIAV